MAPFFVLDEFIQYLTSVKRFSEHTSTAYKKDIEQFIEFAEIKTKEDFNEVNSKLVRAWMVSIMESGSSGRTVNRKLSSLRTFHKWLLKEGITASNPVQGLAGPKISKKLPSFVQQKEMDKQQVDNLFSDSFDGIRDHLIFEILYQTGIRSNELINLKDDQVRSDQIKVLGKRNKERLIPISSNLQELIKVYREARSEIGLKSSYFFHLNSGNKLYPKFVYRKINYYLGMATELDKKSPHILRHTFATHMLNNGAGLEVLKELLGHSNLAATQVYTHNSFSQLTNIYSQSHPRGRKN